MSILQPSVNSLPPEINTLSVLPVIILPDRMDSLRYFIPPPSAVRSIKTEFLIGITDILVESPALKRVIYSDTTNKKFNDGRLYWEDLRNLCTIDSTRYVLVLAKSVLEDFPFIKGEVVYSWNGYTILSKTRWAIFDPVSEQATAIYNFTDTIQIQGDWVSPEIDDILINVCYQAGRKVGKELVPYWLEVTRTFYTGPGRYMRKAGKLASSGKWQQAAHIWNVMVENEDVKIASRASFNLALAYERDDILDQAVLWIEHADSLSTDTIISAYNLGLHQRLQARKILDQQME
jgi:hypothetical protein